MSKVWYVTGASKGLGLALVKKLIEAGHKVAATSRDTGKLSNRIGINDRQQLLPLEVDLTSDNSVSESLSTATAHFGNIDVIVNNAGYGISGTIEELSMEEMSANVEVNLMATLRVVHFAMPYLRKQRSGHIINISSIGGFTGPTGWPIYSATKAAVIAYSEVLAQDVREFGIHVTVVAPGRFRTEFLSGSMVEAKNRIAEYTAVNDLQEKVRKGAGTQTGDPDKAGKALIELTEMKEPPILLFLGADAVQRAKDRADSILKSVEKNISLSLSTDFD